MTGLPKPVPSAEMLVITILWLPVLFHTFAVVQLQALSP